MRKNYEAPKLEITNFNVEDTLMTVNIEPYAATVDGGGSIASGDTDPEDSEDPWN